MRPRRWTSGTPTNSGRARSASQDRRRRSPVGLAALGAGLPRLAAPAEGANHKRWSSPTSHTATADGLRAPDGAGSLLHRLCYPSQKHLLHALPGPRRASQKDQAGFDAGVMGEATDVQGLAHGLPAVPLHQGPQDLLQGHAVQGVVRVLVHDAAIETQPSIKQG